MSQRELLTFASAAMAPRLLLAVARSKAPQPEIAPIAQPVEA